MNLANLKKTPASHSGFEWAGAMARIRRRGVTTRGGRRSLLIGALTASSPKDGRTARSGEGRSVPNADRG